MHLRAKYSQNTETLKCDLKKHQHTLQNRPCKYFNFFLISAYTCEKIDKIQKQTIQFNFNKHISTPRKCGPVNIYNFRHICMYVCNRALNINETKRPLSDPLRERRTNIGATPTPEEGGRVPTFERLNLLPTKLRKILPAGANDGYAN